jgi:peptide/nickel transport system substrate-binding protein
VLNRRDVLKRAGLIGVGGVVALRTGRARAQGGRKPALTIALPSNPETIDPHQFRSVLTGSILINICETLLIRDPKGMELKPLLATSWRNVDPHTWEFSCGAGEVPQRRAFDAEAVKFSIDRTIGSKLNTLGRCCGRRPSAGGADRRSRHGAHHHQVPDPSCPTAWRQVSEHGAARPWPSTAEFVSDRPIGTGPFRFVEYVVCERVVLEASPDYWGAKAVSQRLVWQIVPDPATRVAALARGTIDVMLNLPVPLIPTVEGDAKLAVYSELGSSVHLLLLNALQAPPLRIAVCGRRWRTRSIGPPS